MFTPNYVWRWNFEISPLITEGLPLMVWFDVGRDEVKRSPGGLTDRVINTAILPQFVMCEEDRIVFTTATPEVYAAVTDYLTNRQEHLASYLFQPGPKALGRYPLSSPGLELNVSVTVDGLPVNDVREFVFAPDIRTYTISSLFNYLWVYGHIDLTSQYGANGFVMIMDQLTGDVWFFEKRSRTGLGVAAILQYLEIPIPICMDRIS